MQKTQGIQSQAYPPMGQKGHVRNAGTGMGSVACLATYPPRQCGIATFTADLMQAIATYVPGAAPQIMALSDEVGSYAYPAPVVLELDQYSRNDYLEAAAWVNRNENIRLVSIQHEFGIYGGLDGRYLLDFVRRLEKPIVVTLHTVLGKPDLHKFHIMRELAQKSARLVVMAEQAREILLDTYGLDPEQICVIHHGVPAASRYSRPFLKRKYGLAGKRVISTFGLISRGKGIEYALEALAQIAPEFPDLVYLVIGETHPNIRRLEGENYRESLLRMVEKQGLQGRVQFINRFLTQKELCEYLGLTDIYLTPYVGREQITSGTLAYAVGLGKAIVSTPYFYAQELLAEGRGLLADFKNAESLAACLREILADPARQRELERRAYAFGQQMSWENVAKAYGRVFQEVMEEAEMTPRRVAQRLPAASGAYLAASDLEVAPAPGS